jgi:hypothetical protein
MGGVSSPDLFPARSSLWGETRRLPPPLLSLKVRPWGGLYLHNQIKKRNGVVPLPA